MGVSRSSSFEVPRRSLRESAGIADSAGTLSSKEPAARSRRPSGSCRGGGEEAAGRSRRGADQPHSHRGKRRPLDIWRRFMRCAPRRRSRQHRQGRAHGGVNVARDHDQAGAQADGRGASSRGALRQPRREALGGRTGTRRRIRPEIEATSASRDRGSNEGLGVEFFERVSTETDHGRSSKRAVRRGVSSSSQWPVMSRARSREKSGRETI